MTEYRVIGPFEIDGKATGELVQLDPEFINVQALVDAGHVEVVTSKSKVAETRDTK